MPDRLTCHPETGHPEQVRRLFDEKAATWSAKYAPGGRLTGRLNRLAEVVGDFVPAGGRVLDLGCGTGDMTRHLSRAGFEVTGCDVSASMLARAAAPGSAVKWVRLSADWQVLPFAAGVFDAVIASSVLEYVRAPALVLAECARVLGPDGVLMATVPDVRHPVRWLEWAVRTAVLIPGASALARRWPRLAGYVNYLRISRQRHTASGWSQLAAGTGIITIPVPAYAADRAPLRLLAFRRPASPEVIR